MDDATTPPPGLYYLNYLLDYRSTDIRMPLSNQTLPGSNEVSSRSYVNRLLWVSDRKLLGADYGMEIIAPVVRNSLKVGALGVRMHDSGGSDIYVSPLILGWHSPRWDASVGAGIWLDTARANSSIAPGRGYNSSIVSAGATYYWDESRSWSSSLLLHYQHNSKADSGFRRGDQISAEWGIGKRWGLLKVGAVGYSHWQTRKDTGSGVFGDKSQTHAAGLRASYIFWPSKVMLRASVYQEFGVRASSQPAMQGTLLEIMLAKAF